ncbi:hypothetical protein, partial [Cellulomonas triticagri]
MTRHLVRPTIFVRRRRRTTPDTATTTPGAAFGLPTHTPPDAPEAEPPTETRSSEAQGAAVVAVATPPRGRRGGGADPVGTHTLTVTGARSSRRERRRAVRAAADAVAA